MRPKVVAAILLLAVCVLGMALLIPRAFHRGQVTEAPENVPVDQSQTSVSPQKEISPPAPPAVSNTTAMTNIPAAVAITPAIQDTNHTEYVQERVAELTSLAMNNDADSFNTIWSELSNPDKEIRAGALEAVIQFGDHTVSPRLRELAAQTQDPVEQAAILEAADYLDLPPITDLPRKQPENNPKPSH
jgi:cytoskeletal protein RodZ